MKLIGLISEKPLSHVKRTFGRIRNFKSGQGPKVQVLVGNFADLWGKVWILWVTSWILMKMVHVKSRLALGYLLMNVYSPVNKSVFTVRVGWCPRPLGRGHHHHKDKHALFTCEIRFFITSRAVNAKIERMRGISYFRVRFGTRFLGGATRFNDAGTKSLSLLL